MENILSSFMSLAFLSFPSVGAKTSSHLSYVISSYPTELAIPLLDDHGCGLWARTIPVPYVGPCPWEISAPELSIALRKSQYHEGAQHREGRIFSWLAETVITEPWLWLSFFKLSLYTEDPANKEP